MINKISVFTRTTPPIYILNILLIKTSTKKALCISFGMIILSSYSTKLHLIQKYFIQFEFNKDVAKFYL